MILAHSPMLYLFPCVSAPLFIRFVCMFLCLSTQKFIT
uniref:Uncharacterized protein n=1 Tax=Macrostomum lignano TaxID=282301 RepID=A0A1I8GIW4_9PLAT